MNGVQQPLVTILLSYYNDKQFLRNAIQHILNQTYKNFELILINHATKDCCREIAHSFNDERIIHIDLPENLGAGGGFLLTEVLKIAKGKYYKLCCADDLMLPTCLEKLVDYLESNPDKDVVFSDEKYIDEQGEYLGVLHSQERKGFSFDYDEKKYLSLFFNKFSPLPIASSMVRIDKLKSIHINDSLSIIFDKALWVELMIKGSKIGFVKEPLVEYRIHKNQVSTIANIKEHQKCWLFEHELFYQKFFEINDYEQLKEICKYSPYIDKITPDDKKYYKFIIMHYALMKQDCHGAYIQIEQMLSDYSIAKDLEEKFGFGIKEFRNLYFNYTNTKNPFSDSNIYNNIKLFMKYPKYSLKYWILKKKTENKYSY